MQVIRIKRGEINEMLKELDGKKEIGPEACVEIGENTENSIKD